MLVRTLWWLSLLWLLVCALAIGYFSLLWIAQPNSPLRGEALIGISAAAFYSWPALLLAGGITWKWRSKLPSFEKRFAMAVIGGGLAAVAALSFFAWHGAP